MTSTIRAFWQQLDGPVHPADRPLFEQTPNRFNLDFPPPAFIGDVDNAPIIRLMANGGYDPIKTPAEFPTKQDEVEFINYLKGVRAMAPATLSGYYTASGLSRWIEDGDSCNRQRGGVSVQEDFRGAGQSGSSG